MTPRARRHRRSAWAAILLCAAIGPGPATHAATYHVEQGDPRAADANDGSEAAPWKTIARAAATARGGDAVIIGTGVYREHVKLARSGTAEQPIRFQAAPAARVVVTGADRIERWAAEPGAAPAYFTAWDYDFIPTQSHAHPDDEYHLLIGRCEQVFVNGQPLRQVLDRRQLGRGTFYVDFAARRLEAAGADGRSLADESAIVEASTRGVVWECSGDYVETDGLRFRYAANPAQHGAAVFTGAHDIVKDCVFERMNSVGAQFLGEDIVVDHCTFADNGQLGFGADRAHRLHLVGCAVARNNVKGFSRNWEAGGDKIVLSRGVVIEHSSFVENRGTGLWFDIANEDCIVRNCLFDNNEDAGLLNEISFNLHACDNVFIANGFAGTAGSWGVASGLALSSSPGSVVERNFFVGNKEGISFREQARVTPRIDAPPGSPGEKIWNHDERIAHNVLAYNRDAQVSGWFDVEDQGHWPAAMQNPPQPLSLDRLKFDLSENRYALRPGQSLLRWGVPWKRNKSYSTVEEMTRDLAFGHGSRVSGLSFADFAQHDFRLSEAAADLRPAIPPQGAVPECRLP